MNVNDQWMLEKMQQMAASMAASLPQAGQSTDAPQTEKGESFKDMLDKAKDQKAEAPKQESTVGKTDTVQKKEPVQTVQKTQKVVQTDPKTGLRQIDVTPEEAALLVAGYARLSPPMEDGTVWMVTVQDANGNPVPPLAALEQASGAIPLGNELFAAAEGEWVLDEITPEFTQALERLLVKTNDPRPVESILDRLVQNMEQPQAQTAQPKLEVVVRTDAPAREVNVAEQAVPVRQTERPEGPERPEQTGDEDTDDFGGEVMMAGQPLFKDVKAAPVKVGERFELDTQEPDMELRLADTIRYAAQQDLRQIEIRLSPENLGALTIKLTQSANGTLQVVLHAANARAANLLSQHTDGLNAALQGYGQNSEVRVEVQRGEDSQQAQQQQQQADPNGHNRQNPQQQRRQEETHSGDFLQKLRLGLFSPEDN